MAAGAVAAIASPVSVVAQSPGLGTASGGRPGVTGGAPSTPVGDKPGGGPWAVAANGHGGEALGCGGTRFGMVGVGSRAATFNGARGPTFHLAGDIAELALFDRALSDEERLAVEAYFAERYNG